MITALIIIIGFLLIGFINNLVVKNAMSNCKKNNTFYSNKKIKPKINLVIIIGFALIVASIIFINFFYDLEENSIINKNEIIESTYEEPVISNIDNESSKTYLSVDINPCVISEDFIKQDLRYPKSADFSIFDCKSERKSDGSYTVLRKVSAKNAFGVESEFIYKVNFGFIGGNEVDMNNWKLLSIQSEEYK